MENFDLKKYLVEGKLLKENTTTPPNSYVMWDEEDEMWVPDPEKIRIFLEKYNSEDVDSEEFIENDLYGEDMMFDWDEVSDEEFEELTLQAMSYYFFSDGDSIKKKTTNEHKLNENIYNAYDGNPEVEKTIDGIIDLTTKLRKLGNEAYGGEKKNIYSSEAGDAFKAFDKALSDLNNTLQSVDVKLSK